MQCRENLDNRGFIVRGQIKHETNQYHLLVPIYEVLITLLKIQSHTVFRCNGWEGLLTFDCRSPDSFMFRNPNLIKDEIIIKSFVLAPARVAPMKCRCYTTHPLLVWLALR